MATAAKAFGTKIYRETTPGSGTFTELGGFENLNWPKIGTEMGDTTPLAAGDSFRTRLPTLNNLGPLTGDLFYDSSDATQEQMITDQIAQTARLYKIVGTDGGADDFRFNGYVTGFEIKGVKDGYLMASIEITPTGAPTRS